MEPARAGTQHARPMASASKRYNGSPAWSPLRETLFRRLWIASVLSYSGTWMHNVAAGWLMTSLTSSPLMVAMVQVAVSLPVFLVILPAGALADMTDRRKLLLLTQTWMALAAAMLGVLTLSGAVTPFVLLFLTFLLGLGLVMNDPAWQAITPEVISPPRFSSAVALNSLGFNIARAVGPTIGGALIAVVGSGIVFILNALSFVGVILFLLGWKRPNLQPENREPLLGALATGVRYAQSSSGVRAVLMRAGLFSLFASVMWALLPLIARPHGPLGYGLFLGAFGLGALVGAAVLPILTHMLSANGVLAAATVQFAVVVMAMGRLESFLWLCLIFFLGGAAWMSMLALLNVAAQTMAPAWVRARGLSMYLLVLQGGMALGSAIWGTVALRFSLATAFTAAAVGLLLGLLTMGLYRLDPETVAFRLEEASASAPVGWPNVD